VILEILFKQHVPTSRLPAEDQTGQDAS
jgi:hypothetical protein